MMSNATADAAYDVFTGYLDCIAQSSRDPDVEGYAVRLSLFVANICLAILITWSTEDVEASVYVIFMQTYTLLLVTFISLARQTLSIADAHFALTSTWSPLAIYLVYSTTRWLFNYRSSLYLRLGSGSGPKLVSCLTGGLVVQWIILEIIIYGAPDHVFSGQRCSTPTLVGWVFYRVISLILLVNYSYTIIFLWPLLYLVYTVRHIFDIAREYKRHQQKVKKWGFFRFLQVPWMFIRNWTLSNWIVVTRAHEWMIFLMVLTAYITWASGVGAYIPDMGAFYNWVLQLIHEDEGGWPAYVPDPDFDPYSFGQLLAATVALEPLWEVIKLTWEFRRNLGRTIAHYPQSVWNGIVFLVTGHRNPWKKYMKEREERERNNNADLSDDAIPLHGASGDKFGGEGPGGYALTPGKDEEEDGYSLHHKRYDSSGSLNADYTSYPPPTRVGSGEVYMPTLPAHSSSNASGEQEYNLGTIVSMSPNRGTRPPSKLGRYSSD